MATVDVEFPSGNTTASFFGHTSATQADCESHVAALAEGKAVPATVQGPHSYTVFAGPDLESVVQFRPKSSPLPTESTVLARKIYGDLAPSVSFEGTIGDETSGSDKEPLLVYKMNRIPGATYQEFIGASDTLDNSVEASSYRKTLMVDLAK